MSHELTIVKIINGSWHFIMVLSFINMYFNAFYITKAFKKLKVIILFMFLRIFNIPFYLPLSRLLWNSTPTVRILNEPQVSHDPNFLPHLTSEYQREAPSSGSGSYNPRQDRQRTLVNNKSVDWKKTDPKPICRPLTWSRVSRRNEKCISSSLSFNVAVMSRGHTLGCGVWQRL